MILLIPTPWIHSDNTLEPDLGSMLNALLTTAYEEPLDMNYRWALLVKPEGFPYPGALIDFQSPNEKHNQLVAAFHPISDDSVVSNAMHILGFNHVRSAKLVVNGDMPDEIPKVWYVGVKLNGRETAMNSLAELIGVVKPSDKSVH